MAGIGKLGRDEGKVCGPDPGDGSSSVGGMVAGGGDFEGTPGDQLPPRPGGEQRQRSEEVPEPDQLPPRS